MNSAWSELSADCQECERCELALTRNNVVVGRGNPEARALLIGEAPGQQEDEQGEPFVGRAGQLLEKLLGEAGLDSRRDLYIANVIKCRPPQNRKPTRTEIERCLPWLQQQLELVDPTLVVLAGATALQAVLGIKGGISKLRGQWIEQQGRAYLPIFHPSYLLRFGSRAAGSPQELTLADMQDVRRRLDRKDWPR